MNQVLATDQLLSPTKKRTLFCRLPPKRADDYTTLQLCYTTLQLRYIATIILFEHYLRVYREHQIIIIFN